MVVFDEEALRKAFRNELEGGADLKADHIFEIALSKIMASVFTDNMLLEYIAVRIFPLLSLGGFKVTADEERLFAAIIDDKTEKKTKERMRGHFRECLDHLSMESIGGDNKAGVGDEYNKRPVNILKGYPASFLPLANIAPKRKGRHIGSWFTIVLVLP